MTEYELTPQVCAVLVPILRRAAKRGRELREQQTAVYEAGSKSAAGNASVSERIPCCHHWLSHIETARTLPICAQALTWVVLHYSREEYNCSCQCGAAPALALSSDLGTGE
jgi:hypothetical protein